MSRWHQSPRLVDKLMVAVRSQAQREASGGAHEVISDRLIQLHTEAATLQERPHLCVVDSLFACSWQHLSRSKPGTQNTDKRACNCQQRLGTSRSQLVHEHEARTPR